MLVVLVFLLVGASTDRDSCSANTSGLAAVMLLPLGLPRLLAPVARFAVFVSKPFDAIEQHCSLQRQAVGPPVGIIPGESPRDRSSEAVLLSDHS